MSQPNQLLRAYRRLSHLPKVKLLLSHYFCRLAPYFKSVNPRIVHLEQNYCEARLTKRQALENHIGTVHVIAICNGLEFAMGVMSEASIPAHLRWIPKGMTVNYVGKADSDIILKARLAGSWQVGEVAVEIEALRCRDQKPVVTGQILLWVTHKPAKPSQHK